ncbi:MAG: DUF945 family protein [Gammaproteobacteria bacterium]
MKKLGILLCLVIATLLATTPMVLGLFIDDSSTQARLREMTGQPTLTLNMRSGWFSSIGNVQIEAPVIAGAQYPEARIDADLEVMHGPLLFTEDGLRIGLAWVTILPVLQGMPDTTFLQTLLGAETNSRIHLLANFDGSLHGQLHNDAFSYALVEQRFDFTDLRVDVDIARNSQAQLTASSANIDIHNPLSIISFEQADIELHTSSLERSPLPGSLAVDIAQLQINTEQRLTMRGISIDYVAREEPSAENGPPSLFLQQQLQVQEIESGTPLTALNIETKLEGIDMDIVAQYMGVISNIAVASGPNNPTQDDVLVRMMRSAFTQRSSAVFEAWGGEHSAEIDLQWPGEPSLRSIDDVYIGLLLQKLDAQLNVSADAAALGTSPFAAMVRNYTAQGVLPQNNGNIEITASLQGGSLNLNGQSINLQPFLNLGIARTP